ncbi:putative sensor histidine kinase pdtaS [bacterium HR15]|nr:putative sensor histidine kinase pdtaS [bacterium HR15]
MRYLRPWRWRTQLKRRRRARIDLTNPAHLLDELERKERELQEAQDYIRRLEARLADREAEIEALHRISEATGAAFASEEMLQSIAAIAMRITDADICHIFLFDENREELVLRAATGDDREFIGKIRLKPGEGITGWVARERRPVAIHREAYKDHRFKLYPQLNEEQYESMLAVPLMVNSEVIGVISVRTRKPKEYKQEQIRLLSGIASHLAGALKQLSRIEQLERQASQVATLSEISRTLTGNLYLEEVLQLLVNMTAQTLGYKVVTVLLLDEERGELVLKATQADSEEYRQKPPLRVGESIAGRAVAENRILVIPDVQAHPDYRFPDIAQKAGLHSMACVPLRVRERVIGTLNCYTDRPHLFTDEELRTLEAVANHAALAIDHAKLMVRSAILQEMHHRVKNNLQQIASLLRLQMHYSRYKTVEEVIQDSLSRILAIAQVHELLSREDLDMVSLRKIASSILHNTKQALVPPGKQVRSTVEGDDVLLPLQQATAVALILNELIQNAIEHGFKDRDAGQIDVRVQHINGEVLLEVSNDGEPLPPDFDAARSNTLGVRIIDNLVRGTLRGRFTLASDEERTVATVLFPRPCGEM